LKKKLLKELFNVIFINVLFVIIIIIILLFLSRYYQ